MTRARRLSRILAIVLLLCTIVLPFTGCKTQPGEKSGTITVVVETDPVTAYTVDLDKVTIEKGLISVLDYLKETESGFTYEAQDSTYGAFITKVLTLDSTAVTNGYITLLTSVESDFDVTEYAVEKDYKGTKIVSSGAGASTMKIESGAVYYIALATY